MQLPHKAVVLVADGRKLLFLRNQSDAEYPNLVVETAQEHPNPADRDEKTGAAGQARSTQSGSGAPAVAQGGSNHAGGGGAQFAESRGSMGEADYHQMEEDRFAAEAAELLKTRALRHDYDSLVVVAPPRTLGELRKHYHVEVANRLKGELAKDLTGHTIADIEQALAKA